MIKFTIIGDSMFGKILEIKDNIVVLENNSKKIETNYLNLHVVFPDD